MTKEILESKQIRGLEADYLLDFVKNSDGKLTLDVFQNSDDHSGRLRSIPISDLSSLIAELQYFFELMNIVTPIKGVHKQTNAKKSMSLGDKIVSYYFKGVSISDISKLLNVKKSLITRELTLREISTKSNKSKSKSRF